MNILFSDKVTTYFQSISPKEGLSIIEKIKPLKDKSKNEIEDLKETIALSEEKETPLLYAYFIGDAMYVIFGFKDKKTMLVVDIIELVNNEINSFTLKPDEDVDKKDDE